MHQRIGKKILFYFFLLILFASTHNINFSKLNFDRIKKINISGLKNSDNKILLKELNNLNLENLFFLNAREIMKVMDANTKIENYRIFKKYPSTLEIRIQKTIFLAKINIDGEEHLIGSNGKLTIAGKTHYNLPYIFGKPKIEEFLELKQILDKSKFSYSQIENLYYYPSKRWDLKFKENILLKLPKDFSNELLDNLYEFLERYNEKNFTVIDTRIKNQIILNE